MVEATEETEEAPWDYRQGWEWLRSTYELQTKTYGYAFPLPNEKEEAQYLLWNVFATQQELAEAAVEFSWKPWAMDEPFVNRDRVVDELVDACHFIGNILVALGVTDEEWIERYKAKQEKNRRRAVSGTYSAKKGTLGEGSEDE